MAGDCPGLGFQGDNSSFRGNRKNSRWMRWQSLCRKKPGEEGDHGGKDDEREEGETEDEDDHRSTSRQSHQGSTRSRSPNSSTVGSQGHKVSVLTYHNEEVGVLVSNNQELRVLFHVSQVQKYQGDNNDTYKIICQVWWRHPALGFCQFREILPTSQLSKYLHPGKQARSLPFTHLLLLV